MVAWDEFPVRQIDPATVCYRIHGRRYGPAYFNSDGTWRFDPPTSHRDQYGVCYLGTEPMSAYVEVFGRFRSVPRSFVDDRSLSELQVTHRAQLADITDRSVLGDFGVTAAHSTGTHYLPAQELSANLFDAGFDGVYYRVRHDPAMQLEAIGLFGEPGEQPNRFHSIKVQNIPDDLVRAGEHDFHIKVIASAVLP